MTNNRIEWLDYMKGIAIIVVAMGHVSQHIGNTYPFTHLIIIFEMPLFFLLSGVLAHKTASRSLTTNLKKKLLSLLLPMAVVSCTFGLITDSIQEVLFDTYHKGYWFLLSLFICWLCFLPLSVFVKNICNFRGGLILEIVILLSPFFIYKVVDRYIPTSVDEALTLNFSFTYYRFFIIGYFIGKFMTIIDRKWLHSFSSITVYLYLLVFFFRENWLNGIPMTIQQSIMSAGLFFILYACYQNTNIGVKTQICIIGKSSLTIYLFHYIFIYGLDLSFIQGYCELIVFFVTMLTSVFVCYICMIVAIPITKNKFLNLIILGKTS